MLTHITYWYYANRYEDDRVAERLGPFESETDLVKYLEHERMVGSFDIVRNISIYIK
jgi:hypothetical protein